MLTYHLSKWDPENREKYIGEPEVWNETEQDIRNVLNELNIPFDENIEVGIMVEVPSVIMMAELC